MEIINSISNQKTNCISKLLTMVTNIGKFAESEVEAIDSRDDYNQFTTDIRFKIGIARQRLNALEDSLIKMATKTLEEKQKRRQ